MTLTRFAAGLVIVFALIGLLVLAQWIVDRLVLLLAPC
jgi:hypothetical protein